MEYPEYEISTATIRDIMDKIPPEKHDLVIKDLVDMLRQYRAVFACLNAAADILSNGELSSSDLLQMPETIKWIDDGKHENEIILLCDDKTTHSIKFGEE